MKRFRADLYGHHEVPLVVTDATASFEAELNDAETELTFGLTWTGLESKPLKAHIHLGKPGTSGGDIVTICSATGDDNLGNPVSVMEGLSGAADGTVSARHVTDVATRFATVLVNQGIARGEFAKFVAVLEAGYCYVNIHTQEYQAPIGVLRGQIERASALPPPRKYR